jgi:hypothetical protein
MLSGFISNAIKSPAAGAAAPEVALAAAEEDADDAAEVAADELADDDDDDDDESSLPQPTSANPTTTPLTARHTAVCLCRTVMRTPQC